MRKCELLFRNKLYYRPKTSSFFGHATTMMHKSTKIRTIGDCKSRRFSTKKKHQNGLKNLFFPNVLMTVICRELIATVYKRQTKKEKDKNDRGTRDKGYRYLTHIWLRLNRTSFLTPRSRKAAALNCKPLYFSARRRFSFQLEYTAAFESDGYMGDWPVLKS